MKCIVCKGIGILDKEQTEICPNCEGAGVIITEDMVNGNDCQNGSCT